jgi:hypothetical protein
MQPRSAYGRLARCGNQVGGSLGAALLDTIAASYLTRNAPHASRQSATVHGTSSLHVPPLPCSQRAPSSPHCPAPGRVAPAKSGTASAATSPSGADALWHPGGPYPLVCGEPWERAAVRAAGAPAVPAAFCARHHVAPGDPPASVPVTPGPAVPAGRESRPGIYLAPNQAASLPVANTGGRRAAPDPQAAPGKKGEESHFRFGPKHRARPGGLTVNHEECRPVRPLMPGQWPGHGRPCLHPVFAREVADWAPGSVPVARSSSI